jgi:hypothetical protein
LHSFDFAFGVACVSASKGKCVQCAVALEFFERGLFLIKLFLRSALEAVSSVVQIVSKKG